MNTAAMLYVALLAYPVITLLVPDPNSLRWWLQTGGGGIMPEEIRERCKRNQGNLLITKFILLVPLCLALMKLASVPPTELGFTRDQPRWAILAGFAAGLLLICWIWSMKRLAEKIKVPSEGPPYLLREGTYKLLLIMVLGGFAEELWRALSLVTFRRAGISDVSAVLVTSIVFGVGHLFSFRSFGTAVGRALAPAIAGVFFATLFLWWGTLLVPFIAHVMLNSFGTIMGRKRIIANESS